MDQANHRHLCDRDPDCGRYRLEGVPAPLSWSTDARWCSGCRRTKVEPILYKICEDGAATRVSSGDARAQERRVTRHGGDYLDGKIMADPQNVGTSRASFDFSGAENVFRTHEATLQLLGDVSYHGDDPGAAAVQFQAHCSRCSTRSQRRRDQACSTPVALRAHRPNSVVPRFVTRTRSRLGRP